MKTVWILFEVDLGGTSSYKVYATEKAANEAVKATKGVFAHAYEYEVLK